MKASTPDLDTLRSHLPAHLLVTLDTPVPARTRPRILLVGITNAGKTSLLRRLAVEIGVPVPESARVAGDPCTAEMLDLDLGFAIVRDSPGTHAAPGEPGATTEDLIDEAVDADHTVLLVGPSLWTPGEIPSAVLACPFRAASTTMVVSRIDEVGVDPLLDPEGFAVRVADKLAEVHERIVRTGLHAPARLLALAADPDGTSVDEPDVCREDFDMGRPWDGMDSLLDVLREVRPDEGGRRHRRDLHAVRRCLADLPDRAHVAAAAEVAQGAVKRLDHQRTVLDRRLEGLAAEAGVHGRTTLVAGASPDAAWTAGVEKGRDASAEAIGRWLKRMSDLAECLPEPALDATSPSRAGDARTDDPAPPAWADQLGDRFGRFVQNVGDLFGSVRSDAKKDAGVLEGKAQQAEAALETLTQAATASDTTRRRREQKLADLTARVEEQSRRAEQMAKATTALKVAGALVELAGPLVASHLAERRAEARDADRDRFADELRDAVTVLQAAMLDGVDGNGPGPALDRLRSEQARIVQEPQRVAARERALMETRDLLLAGGTWGPPSSRGPRSA